MRKQGGEDTPPAYVSNDGTEHRPRDMPAQPGGDDDDWEQKTFEHAYLGDSSTTFDMSNRAESPSANMMNELKQRLRHRKETPEHVSKQKPEHQRLKPPRPPKPQSLRQESPGRVIVKEANTENSLVADMAHDSWKLLKILGKMPKISYPVWKWVLVGYLIWMPVSYLALTAFTRVVTVSNMLCEIPLVGSQLGFCRAAHGKPLNFEKIATSQEQFTVVMDQVGQSFDLARDMVSHEFAVRDLRIRVTASKLPRKSELARELESLIRQTKQAAKGLSRFTAKVGKAIDTAKAFDDYAVNKLEGIVTKELSAPSTSGQIISALNPFGAFKFAGKVASQEEIKQVFITTATRISGKVNVLLEDSFEQSHTLDSIQETLDRIKEIAFDELGDLPRDAVLSKLWNLLSPSEDSKDLASHTKLLTDMTEYYKSSSDVMKLTVGALNQVEAELGEFRDEFATPALILQDTPLQVIIALLRRSAETLEMGRVKLGGVEAGWRPAGGTTTVRVATTAPA